jgi:hypothetical protein
MNMIMTMVNTSYIWFMWYAFIRMPEDQRRFLVVCLGTVYPLVSSTVALSTTSTKKNATERYWLTYWSIHSTSRTL